MRPIAHLFDAVYFMNESCSESDFVPQSHSDFQVYAHSGVVGHVVLADIGYLIKVVRYRTDIVNVLLDIIENWLELLGYFFSQFVFIYPRF
jgi:hypothetical protein